MVYNQSTQSTTIVVNTTQDDSTTTTTSPRERIIPIRVEQSNPTVSEDSTRGDVERSFRTESSTNYDPNRSKNKTIIKVSKESNRDDNYDDDNEDYHKDSRRYQPQPTSVGDVSRRSQHKSSMKLQPQEKNINTSRKSNKKKKDTSSSSSSSSESSDSDLETDRKHSKNFTTTTKTSRNVSTFPFTKEIPRRHSIEIETTIEPTKSKPKKTTGQSFKKSSSHRSTVGGDVNNNPDNIKVITQQPGKSILKSHPVASSTPIPPQHHHSHHDEHSITTMKSNVIRKKPSKCSKCTAWWCSPFKLCCNCAPFECECCDCCYWKCFRCQQCICQCCNQKCC